MYKKALLFISFLFLTFTGLFAQSVLVKDYTITYDGVTINSAENTSTWTYTVSAIGSQKDLSHWVLELCQDHTVISSTVSPWEVPNNGDPTTHVYGIKWDGGLSVGNTKTYSFTLDGIYAETTVQVAIKTGGRQKVDVKTITGPSCDPIEAEKAAIGDRVWDDTNRDGIQDPTENGFANVVVKLYDCNNHFKQSTTTNSSGNYLFENLSAGDYYLKFCVPAGYVISAQDQGSDDTADSDVDPATGKTTCTELSAGETDLSWDLGIYTEEVCVTDFSVTWTGDNELCEFEPQLISVEATVELTPNPSSATIVSYWKQTFPDIADTNHSQTTQVGSSTDVEIFGNWPGVTATDTYVELEFGVEVFDCDNNKIGSTETYTVHWDAAVCPPPTPDKPDVRIEKTSNTADAENGDNVTFTITVTNDGPGSATGIEVSDLLPDGLEFISATASAGSYNSASGIWTVGTMAEAASATLTLSASVNVTDLNNSAFDFGLAGDYNIFVRYDMVQYSGDTEGKMAVGRNADLRGYSIGDKLPIGNNGDVLVVNKNLNYATGRVFNGNAVYGGNSNLPIFPVTVDGSLRKEKDVFDFETAYTQLKSLSAQLQSRAANGTTVMETPNLKLEGSDPYLNIFDVSSNDLNSAVAVLINVPNGSVVIVNISGNNIDWSGGLDITGTAYGNIIYNFHQAKNLKITSMEMRGTVLAPLANLDASGGFFNGQVFVKSCVPSGQYSTQFNNNPFVGNIGGSKELINAASITGLDQEDPNTDNNTSAAVVTVTTTPENNTTTSNGNWNTVNTVPANELVWAFGKDNNGNQLLGTWGGHIYRFSGTEYELLNQGMGVAYVWAFATDAAGNIYVGTEKGLYTSTNNGTDWTNDQLSGKDIRALAIDNNGVIYAGAWGYGVYRFNGSDWSQVNDGLVSTAIHGLAVNSENEIFAATFDTGIYRLNNGGSEWSKLDVGFEYIWTIAVAADDVLFAGTYGGGVFISYDDGDSWIQRNNGLSNHYIYTIQVDDTDIYLSTWASGVYRLQLYGGVVLGKQSSLSKLGTSAIDWEQFGLEGLDISSIYVDPETSDLYAATRSGEVYIFVPSSTGLTNETLPTEFELKQNYPNPFNPATIIEFSIAEKGRYKLQIFNILGQLVETIADQDYGQGNHKHSFNAAKYTSGVYFYRLSGQNINITKKMIMLK